MGDVSEIQQAKAWIYSVLHGQSDIAAAVLTRIYADFVPEPPASRVYSYILYNFMGGTDVDALGTVRIFARPLFQCRLVTNGRPTASDRLVEKRMDTALQTAVSQPSGDYYFSARREQPIDRTELDTTTGKQYGNIGGLYRLWIG